MTPSTERRGTTNVEEKNQSNQILSRISVVLTVVLWPVAICLGCVNLVCFFDSWTGLANTRIVHSRIFDPTWTCYWHRWYDSVRSWLTKWRRERERVGGNIPPLPEKNNNTHLSDNSLSFAHRTENENIMQKQLLMPRVGLVMVVHTTKCCSVDHMCDYIPTGRGILFYIDN